VASRTVLDVVFVMVYVFGPSNVVFGKRAGCLKVLECLVVGVYCEWGLTGLEIDGPLADSFDYGKHLCVANAVVKLGFRELAGVEGNRALFGLVGRRWRGVSLREYGGDSVP